ASAQRRLGCASSTIRPSYIHGSEGAANAGRPATSGSRCSSTPSTTEGQTSACEKPGLRPEPGSYGASARGRGCQTPPCHSIAPATAAYPSACVAPTRSHQPSAGSTQGGSSALAASSRGATSTIVRSSSPPSSENHARCAATRSNAKP